MYILSFKKWKNNLTEENINNHITSPHTLEWKLSRAHVPMSYRKAMAVTNNRWSANFPLFSNNFIICLIEAHEIIKIILHRAPSICYNNLLLKNIRTRELRLRNNGGNVNHVQYKSDWNRHFIFPTYWVYPNKKFIIKNKCKNNRCRWLKYS
jgi:hypothetical protein